MKNLIFLALCLCLGMNLNGQIKITDIKVVHDCLYGGSIDIKVEGATGEVTYEVDPGSNGTVSSQESSIFHNIERGDYLVFVEDDLSQDISTFQITGWPNVGPSLGDILVTSSLCSNQINLCIPIIGSSTEDDLIWYNEGLAVQWGGQCITVDSDSSGELYQVINSENCRVSNAADLTQIEMPATDLTFNCSFAGLKIESKYIGGNSYQWYKDGERLEGENNRSILLAEDISNRGVYHVEFLTSDCGIQSSEEYEFDGSSPEYHSFDEILICRGDTVEIAGFQIFREGLFNFKTIAQDGCDSLIQREVIIDDSCEEFFQGRVFYDQNENGIFDIEDSFIPNIDIEINGVETITTGRGRYYYRFEQGASYNLSILIDDRFVPTTTTSHSFVGQDDTHTMSYDFGLTFAEEFVELEATQNIFNGRCNEQGSLSVNVSNLGIPTPFSEEIFVEIEIDPSCEILDVIFPGAEIMGQSIFYSFTRINLFEERKLRVDLQFPDETNIGEILTFKTTLKYTDIQGTEKSETFIQEEELRCSFDPNDKQVSPVGLGDENYTMKDSELFYTIRFQNTGNDFARHISIIDTLNENLNLETFKILDSSHPVVVMQHPDREMEFLFRNIMLPDSIANEPESHGYVTYSLTANENLPDFTIIDNTAQIYFDSNPPIVTNTTISNLVDDFPTSTSDVLNAEVTIMPNPATDRIYVHVAHGGKVMLRLYDTSSRELLTKEGNGVYLEVDHLESGLYFLQVSVDGLTTVRPLVVEN